MVSLILILLLEGNYLLQIENLLLVINHLKFDILFHTILKMHAYQIASIFTKTLPYGETFFRDWLAVCLIKSVH